MIFKLLADRLPEDDDLASQPTLSRFENSISASSLLQLEEWYIERFVRSFSEPPREITLDVDLFDDPTHGQQQLTFFHGHYDQYQYQVRAITCAENDFVVLPVRFSTAHEALPCCPEDSSYEPASQLLDVPPGGKGETYTHLPITGLLRPPWAVKNQVLERKRLPFDRTWFCSCFPITFSIPLACPGDR